MRTRKLDPRLTLKSILIAILLAGTTSASIAAPVVVTPGSATSYLYVPNTTITVNVEAGAGGGGETGGGGGPSTGESPKALSSHSNPGSGSFGTGQVRTFGEPDAHYFTVPEGITSVRVRLWGGGANGGSDSGTRYGGGGGGFAMRVISGLASGQVITVIVGNAGEASDFGGYLSATGGSLHFGGQGVGGDVNSSGGQGGRIASTDYSPGGGGVGSLFGRGGAGASTSVGLGGGSGGGGNYRISGGNTLSTTSGGSGLTGSSGGTYRSYMSEGVGTPGPSSGIVGSSVDFIGTGSGGAGQIPGQNGGGGGGAAGGGFPGGGGGYSSPGAQGLVIVEF